MDPWAPRGAWTVWARGAACGVWLSDSLGAGTMLGMLAHNGTKGFAMRETKDVKTIVVGVDGSEPSIEALRYARVLAGPLSATVVALACWDVPPIYDGYVAMGIDRFDTRAGEILKEAVEKAFGPEMPANVETRLVQGHPRRALIEASDSADMLVLGRRGHGGFGGLLLGSVSSALVAHAHCPVLVVHAPKKS